MSFNNYHRSPNKRSVNKRSVPRGNSVRCPSRVCEFCGGDHHYEQCRVTPSNNQEPYDFDMPTSHHAYQPQAPIVEDTLYGEVIPTLQDVLDQLDRMLKPTNISTSQMSRQGIENEDLEELRELGSVQRPSTMCEFCGGDHRYEQCHVTPSNNQEPYYSDMATFHHAYEPQAPIVEDKPSREEMCMLQEVVARVKRVRNPTNISTLQNIKNEDLVELWELGSGAFGTVYHGVWRGADVAIKQIKKSCFTDCSYEQERLTEYFWREADILSKLHHPNVVAFYGVVQDGPRGTLSYVTEFMVNGSLRNVLLKNGRQLDVRKRFIIALDAAIGMEYLHSKNIVHFDLKSDNLLVNLIDPVRPICKVADFGLSKRKKKTLVTGGMRGTLPWLAPELLNGSSKVSEKVDVFSFGIVLWEIMTGNKPYAHMHDVAIMRGIVSDTLRPPVPDNCALEYNVLMEECWASDPAVRPSFKEIVSRLQWGTLAWVAD